MGANPRVLLIDDQAGDIAWLVDLISSYGYNVDLATNERAGRERLLAMKSGEVKYALAIIDIMVAVEDLMELEEIDETFYRKSRDSGIRLCRYAREDLGFPKEALLIACLSVRQDTEVQEDLKSLDIQLYPRLPQRPSESIRTFIEENLPAL